MRTNPAKLELRSSANLWYIQVARALKVHGIEYFQSSPNNRVRLLNWKVWQLRYGVSLPWIISHLLERFKLMRQRSAKNALGIPIPTATGEKAHEHILSCINQEFPSGENLAVKRSELQARMLHLPNKININGEQSVEDYIRNYRTKALSFRTKVGTEASQFQRPWRNNPWK